MLALVSLMVAFASACAVVVEREQRGEAPAPPGDGFERGERVDPAPLEPSADHGPIGSLGWALLSGEVPRVVLEIDEFGAALAGEAVDALKQALRDHGRKGSVERIGHTTDEDSVMHWAVESPTIAEVFRTGPPSEFTRADMQEMARIREQRPDESGT